MKTIKITKFHPRIAHDVGEVATVSDESAAWILEGGFGVEAKNGDKSEIPVSSEQADIQNALESSLVLESQDPAPVAPLPEPVKDFPMPEGVTAESPGITVTPVKKGK